jgi:hypothetical protein
MGSTKEIPYKTGSTKETPVPGHVSAGSSNRWTPSPLYQHGPFSWPQLPPCEIRALNRPIKAGIRNNFSPSIKSFLKMYISFYSGRTFMP